MSSQVDTHETIVSTVMLDLLGRPAEPCRYCDSRAFFRIVQLGWQRYVCDQHLLDELQAARRRALDRTPSERQPAA